VLLRQIVREHIRFPGNDIPIFPTFPGLFIHSYTIHKNWYKRFLA